MVSPAVHSPARAELERVARDLGLGLREDELDAYAALLGRAMTAYQRLEELPEALPELRYARDAGRPPRASENALGGWVWRGRVEGAPRGPLAGLRFVVKDNVAVAGWPMSVGSPVLEGFVPEETDATVVTRALDAGAELVGKAACEDLCFSGGSHTAVTGPVRNPHDPTRMAGGSSSGCGVLVATGDADFGIGTDQGGSIAIPAAWCGIVGVKPTYGLLPYTGIVPVETSLDHAGVLAKDVATAARAVEALAGRDGFDPRQGRAPEPEPYAEALDAPAEGLRVGLLREGFDWPGWSDPDVETLVSRFAHDALPRLGMRVRHASVPLHRDATIIAHAVSAEGFLRTAFERAPTGPNAEGLHLSALADAYADGYRARAHELAPPVKLALLAGRMAQRRARGRFYARAQNVRRLLRAQYAQALGDADLLVMPTVPFLPHPLPGPNAGVQEVVDAAFQTMNTGALDLTGHPTLSLPVGTVDGLPVGMLMVARHGGERTLFAAGAAIERALRKKPRS